VTLAPCDDGTALAFDASLEKTVEHLRTVVGSADADAYRRFAGWAGAAVALLHQTQEGPPPSLRELAALAETALGPQGRPVPPGPARVGVQPGPLGDRR
jgi:hypothetical protein